LNAELFVALLRKMMRHRSKPVHLVLDGLPAHKTALVKTYVASTNGMLTLHFLPGYASELNPDELLWSHMKRSGVATAAARRKAGRQDRRTARHHQALGPVSLPSPNRRLYRRLVGK
jgi:transposase